jgi:heme-degrading monooxygenase HmoA
VIARMWETKISAGQLDEFCAWVTNVAWPQYEAAPGFEGGELYRADDHDRAVIVTRWIDRDALAAGNTWFDLGAERFCAREPDAWEFTHVAVGELH